MNALDRDDPLAALAADRRDAVAAHADCDALAPLLAVPADELDAADRARLVGHLDDCARCRAVAVEVWLDGDSPLPALASRPWPAPTPSPSRSPSARAPLARAIALAPRTRRGRVAAGAVVASAALAAGVWLVAGSRTQAPSDPAPPSAGHHAHRAPTPSLAVVIAYPGTEGWIGNEKYREPPDLGDHREPQVIHKVMNGYYDGLAKALADLPAALPSGTKVGLLAVDLRGVMVQRPITATKPLDVGALGPEERYMERIGSGSLVQTAATARDLLVASGANRRVLVLVGAACGDGAPPSAVLDRLRADHIELRVIYAETEFTPGCEDDARHLDPAMIRIYTPPALSGALQRAIAARP